MKDRILCFVVFIVLCCVLGARFSSSPFDTASSIQVLLLGPRLVVPFSSSKEHVRKGRKRSRSCSGRT